MSTEDNKSQENPSEAGVCSLCLGFRKCPICAGKGIWYKGSLDEEECASCKGSKFCPKCRGSGRAEQNQIECGADNTLMMKLENQAFTYQTASNSNG